MAYRTQKTPVYNIRISQGYVATSLRCGRSFNNTFIANCLHSHVFMCHSKLFTYEYTAAFVLSFLYHLSLLYCHYCSVMHVTVMPVSAYMALAFVFGFIPNKLMIVCQWKNIKIGQHLAKI